MLLQQTCENYKLLHSNMTRDKNAMNGTKESQLTISTIVRP